MPVSFAYTRWRKGITHNGLWARVTYTAPLQPYGAWFVIGFVGLVCLTNGFSIFFDFKIADFIAAYITLPIIVALYIGHKVYEYFKLGRIRFLRRIEEMDLTTGLDMIEHEDAEYIAPVPRNFIEKAWYWLC